MKKGGNSASACAIAQSNFTLFSE